MTWALRWAFALAVILSPPGAPSGPLPSPTSQPAPPGAPGSAFRLPVAPPSAVLTPFRPPPTRYGPGHRGVDLGGTQGSAVLAAGAGRVVFAGRLAGRGVVSVEHSAGLRTTYEPLSPAVRAGQAVRAGDVLGSLEAGHPGCAPRVCLHWGARLPDGSYLDPLTLITGLRVRLKPWGGARSP